MNDETLKLRSARDELKCIENVERRVSQPESRSHGEMEFNVMRKKQKCSFSCNLVCCFQHLRAYRLAPLVARERTHLIVCQQSSELRGDEKIQ